MLLIVDSTPYYRNLSAQKVAEDKTKLVHFIWQPTKPRISEGFYFWM